MKNRKWKYLTLTLVALVAFCSLTAAALTTRSSYVPENEVSQMNYARSREFVGGTGYQFDEYTKKQQQQEEVKHEQAVQNDPVQQARKRKFQPYRPTYRPSTQPVRRPQQTTPARKPQSQKKQEKPKKTKPEPEPNREKEKEEISELPVITTSLKKDETVNGTVKKFTVKAVSYDGEDISADNIVVKANGERLLDNGAGTYKMDVQDGKNVVEITARDEAGNSDVLTVEFNGVTEAEPEVIGSLNVVVTADALGLGTVCAGKSVDIYENEQLSDVVKRYFSDAGIKAEDIGGDHYEVGRIRKNGIIDDIPEEKVQELEENGISLPDDKDSLGLNDFGPGSGWMYSVDGSSPNKYMSSMDPADGSTVEIYYSVSAM